MDALLGNFDRPDPKQLENMAAQVFADTAVGVADGFAPGGNRGKFPEIAPVYDCGSCLYPQLGTQEMEAVLNDESEINDQPLSALGKILTGHHQLFTAPLIRIGS